MTAADAVSDVAAPVLPVASAARLPYHRLNWSEYAVNDQAEGQSAQTQTFLSCSFQMRTVATGPNQFVATFTDLELCGGFDAAHSWRRGEVRTDDELLLRHEQGHLDLNELKVREMRALLVRNIPMGMGRTEQEAMVDLNGRITAFYNQQNAALREIQERYDRETRNGRKRSAQARWSEKLRTALESPVAVPLSTL